MRVVIVTSTTKGQSIKEKLILRKITNHSAVLWCHFYWQHVVPN